jgi:HAD superfamily hydrolase (TIGR01509 family)
MPTKFETVLWDMDGTLIDSEPMWGEEELALANEYGIPWSATDSLTCLGGPISRVDAHMRALSGNRFAPGYLSDALIKRMVTRLSQGVAFAPGARPLLDEMRNAKVKLGLVTASTRSIVEAAMRSVGDAIFSSIVSADDVPNPKPDPAGYLKAALELDSKIEKCLIIEDSPNGMRAAISSGAFVLGLDHGRELPTSSKTKMVQNLLGLNWSQINDLFQSEETLEL